VNPAQSAGCGINHQALGNETSSTQFSTLTPKIQVLIRANGKETSRTRTATELEKLSNGRRVYQIRTDIDDPFFL
jgi:hypothetical protein